MRHVTTLLVALLLVGIPASATGQTPSWQNQLAVTGGAQLPTSTFSDRWKTGAGIAGTYYYRPSSHFFFGFRAGYHRFRAKAADATLNVIPLHFASKLNFRLTGVQPYLGLDGGPYLLRGTASNAGSTEFGLAPKFGFRLPIAHGVDIDLNATYEVLFREPESTTYWGLNAGFAYIFGR